MTDKEVLESQLKVLEAQKEMLIKHTQLQMERIDKDIMTIKERLSMS